MGLAWDCRSPGGLVQLHDGEIRAHSEGVGRGSEFVVRLPLAPLAPIEADCEAPSRALKASLRVLVVDDNHDVADSLAMLLRCMGSEVRVAYSGAAALEAIGGFKPHAAFIDIGMPGMDGFETAKRARKLPGGEGLVLVCISGWGRAEEMQRSRRAGFDHHLVKPVDPDVIESLLASLPNISGA